MTTSADSHNLLSPLGRETIETFEAHLRVRVSAMDLPGDLADAVAHGVLTGGKRLRPLLVLLACRAAGGREVDALPAAVAIEMVHAFSLVHDDLPAMDDDDLRRGLPTVHKRFGEAVGMAPV